MRGFAYGNARLRAMKSRLLSRRDLGTLVESGSVKGLIVALTKTAYRKAVENALTRTTGLACISEALQVDMLEALGKIGSFYTEEPGNTVGFILRRYDIFNLKTVFRGLSKSATPGEILGSLIPVGELKYAILVELARAPDARAAIDLLASMNSSFSWPLLKLRAEFPGVDIPRMELALDQWYYREARAYRAKAAWRESVLSSSIKMEADLVNLLVVMRFAHAPDERKILQEWLGSSDLAQALVGPGTLPFKLLVEAGMQETVKAAVDLFAGTPFESPLHAGLTRYIQSGRLSDLEKQLRRLRLRWMAEQIVKDPLGIGVVLGYLALKESEVGNIRWIAQGINLGQEGSAILAELEWAE